MTSPGTVVYDSEAQALYIHAKKGKIVRTLELTPDVLVDFDAEGNVIGIEALFLSNNVVVSESLNVKRS